MVKKHPVLRTPCWANGSPYVQDWSAQNFVPDAGLIGRGWLFGRPEFFGKNATTTGGGAAWLSMPISSPLQRVGLGLGLGSGWSGPTCRVEIDDTRPAQSFVPTRPAHHQKLFVAARLWEKTTQG